MTSEKGKADPRIGTARTNIKLAIAIRDTTAAEVSRGAGLSVNGLGAFLRGKSSISYANLLKVCDVLDVPIGILHMPSAVTPARLELHSALEGVPPEKIEEALLLLEEAHKSA